MRRVSENTFLEFLESRARPARCILRGECRRLQATSHILANLTSKSDFFCRQAFITFRAPMMPGPPLCVGFLFDFTPFDVPLLGCTGVC